MTIPKFNINKDKILKAMRLVAKPVIAITISAIICYLFANRIMSITSEIKLAQTLNATLQKRIEAISKMKEDLAKIGDKNYEKIENALISTDNITDAIVAFDDLASKHGMRITPSLGSNVAGTGLAIKDGPAIVSLDYTITAITNINTFTNFLKAFEKATFMPTVSGMDVNSSSERGWLGSSSITIRGKLYVKQN